MEVIGYLHNADLLLEDEQGIAVIGGSHYVLSLGDQVFIQSVIDESTKRYMVKISFASASHNFLHDDEIQIKYEGCKDSLHEYIHANTVH